jgi:hypothetical protein
METKAITIISNEITREITWEAGLPEFLSKGTAEFEDGELRILDRDGDELIPSVSLSEDISIRDCGQIVGGVICGLVKGIKVVDTSCRDEVLQKLIKKLEEAFQN